MDRAYIVPEYEGSIFQAWAKSYCAKNYWRVLHSIGGYEDCLAECALAWIEVCRRYGGTVNNDRWMMHMFKLWVIGVFDTKSCKDTNNRTMLSKLEIKDEPSFEDESELRVKLQDASSELKTVLNVFLNAPQEILVVLRKDTSSCHPMQFFKAVVAQCGIPVSRSASLAKELQTLLDQ